MSLLSLNRDVTITKNAGNVDKEAPDELNKVKGDSMGS